MFFLELESVFNTPGLVEPFSFAMPASYNALPFAQPPVITGSVRNRAGVVTLQGTAQVQLAAQCDRCADEFTHSAAVPLHHTLVLSLNNENTDDFVLLQGYRFSPCDLIWEDIVLAMPPRILCDADCAGLCNMCGTNHNIASCNCVAPQPENTDTTHPFAHLKDII
ncbi:MAG: DUF177 domain-containing protein [Oscillospiraceae bacterium]|nr:DUF177 domain-containing protein [Oscillospiraceae bacterium]